MSKSKIYLTGTLVLGTMAIYTVADCDNNKNCPVDIKLNPLRSITYNYSSSSSSFTETISASASASSTQYHI